MKKIASLIVSFSFSLLIYTCAHGQEKIYTDVLVIGGGTGGTAAGIQSARLGAKTVIIESTPWLGGMLSAAGVTATDGNNKLYSGIWQEFREALYKHYGTRDLMTGWVSNTQFEPHVADSIFKAMAVREKSLLVKYNYNFSAVLMDGRAVKGATFKNVAGNTLTVYATITIDATELGDAFAKAGVKYSLGMEANDITQENVGITQTNDIVQDLTYAAILKDYGKGADKTISKPANYDPKEFDGCCTDYYHDTTIEAPKVDAAKMLDYGKLPNGKYMINWPPRGNDTYLNIVEMTDEQRAKALEAAKQTTLRFIYFIQTQLGYKNLGLADDEFNTKDQLAYIPYHREGRRVDGVVRFTMRNISEPFSYGDPLYRTGISVGDYPIDHHHKKNKQAPQHLYFYPIPSFNVPLGSLVSKGADNLIVADKGISVSNVVNGTTRLQPCVLLTGQAAGVLAALSVQQKKQPAIVSIRKVQQVLLTYNAYIMPYIDVTPEDKAFAAMQRVGATGILKGKGVSYMWANQTWFYPDSTVQGAAFIEDIKAYEPSFTLTVPAGTLTVADAIRVVHQLAAVTTGIKMPIAQFATKVKSEQKNKYTVLGNDTAFITRRALSVLLDSYAKVFTAKDVNWRGQFIPAR